MNNWMWRLPSVVSLCVLAGITWPVVSSAQTPVDAGALRQQIERERQKALPKPSAAPEPGKPAAKPAVKGDARITVSVFVFKGNTLLSNEELSYAVRDFLNRPLTFDALQAAAAVVGDAYRDKGWIVRSFLPKQDIVDGLVIIEVVEAKFGKTKIESDKIIWLTPEKAAGMVKAQQPDGAKLNTAHLDRALLLMDDLPGVAASGRLEQGDKDGETDLVIKMSPEPFATGIGIVDNAGSRATGRARVHGNLQLMSPAGIGDKASAYLLHTQGMDYGQLEYTLPMGTNGFRVGMNGSLMQYKIIDDTFSALNPSGNSSSIGLQSSYPLIRARQRNLYLNTNYDHRFYDNDSGGARSSRYNTDSVTVALRGNTFDKFGGGGSNNASLGFVLGTLNLGSIDAGEDAALSGRYRKMTYSAGRVQSLTPTVTFSAQLTGQASPDNKLDSSEMFYLGGPAGVRAYPVSEGSGVSGQLMTGELRWQMTPSFATAAFYDYGRVHNNGNIKSYSLKGSGLSLNWQSGFGMYVNATWARRLGSNPNPTPSGYDQDGSLDKNRFWLTLSYQF